MPFNPTHYRRTFSAIGNPTDRVAFDVAGERSAISLLKGILATAGSVIPDHSVSFAKLQQVIGPCFLGRGPANLGDVQSIGVGAGLQFVPGNNTIGVTNVGLLNGINSWSGSNSFSNGLSTYDGSKFSILNQSDQSKRLQFDLAAMTPGVVLTVHAPVIGTQGWLALLQNGTTFAQPLDDNLTALANLSGTNTIYYRAGASTWSPVVIGANLTFSGGTLSATGGGGSGTGSVNTVGPVTAAQLAGYADATGTIIQGVSIPGPGLAYGSGQLTISGDLLALENLTGTNTLYYRSGTNTWSPVTVSSPGLSFSGGTLAVALPLSAIAAVSPSADTVPFFNTTTTAAVTALTSFGRQLIASANAATAATLIGAQPLDDDLTSLSGLAGTNTIYYRSGAGAWSPVTIGANLTFTGGVLAAAGATGGGVSTSGPVTSAMLTGYADATGNLIRGITMPGAGLALVGAALTLANDLSALEALTGTNTIYYRSGTDAWSAVTIGANLTFSGGTLSAVAGGGGVSTSGAVTAAMMTGYVDATGTLIRGINMPASGISLSGNNMVLTNDLASLEAASATDAMYYRSAANTWTPVTVGGGLGFSGGSLTVTNVTLAALAAVTPAADTVPYFTSASAAATTSLTAAARTLIGQPSASAMLTTLGGQPLDGDLTSLAGASGTNTIYYRSATDSWSPVTFSGLSFTGGVLAVTAGAGNVSNTGTPTAGQIAQWTDATHIQGVAPSIGPPQGRLTLVSGTPVMTASTASKNIAYYTPYVGNCIPIYNGTTWTIRQFAELSRTLTGAAADKNQDWFVWDNGGTLQLIQGPDWTNDSSRALNISPLNGLYVNTSAITSGPAAQRGTYVGTTRTYNDAGTVFLQWKYGGITAGGVPGFFSVWNAYNRVPFCTTVQDSTGSYTVFFAAWRQYNASVGNQVTLVKGLVDDQAVVAHASAYPSNPAGTDYAIGISVAGAAPPAIGYLPASIAGQIHVHRAIIPPIGAVVVQLQEMSGTGSASTVFGGAGQGQIQQFTVQFWA